MIDDPPRQTPASTKSPRVPLSSIYLHASANVTVDSKDVIVREAE